MQSGAHGLISQRGCSRGVQPLRANGGWSMHAHMEEGRETVPHGTRTAEGPDQRLEVEHGAGGEGGGRQGSGPSGADSTGTLHVICSQLNSLIKQ